jgi:hypothetical protein
MASAWEVTYLPVCPHPDDPHKYYGADYCQICRHNPYYSRCLNCGKTLDDLWRILAIVERGFIMPSLSSLMSGAEVTWGEQYDKGALRGTPFWIHKARVSQYQDFSDPKNDGPEGRTIEVIVLDITLNGSSRRDPHAVITVGNSPEREPILSYFMQKTEPIGPVHCFEVPLKGGRSFWRIEDYDAEVLNAAALAEQFDANGKQLTGSKSDAF